MSVRSLADEVSETGVTSLCSRSFNLITNVHIEILWLLVVLSNLAARRLTLTGRGLARLMIGVCVGDPYTNTQNYVKI